MQIVAFRSRITFAPGRGGHPGTMSDSELSSTYPADTDTEQLVDGGPPPAGGGMVTTTGGTAGPASFPQRANSGPGVANTTTGDATTGAMRTPPEEYTSDTAG
ncbi:hypothetical protein ACTI_09090 [Actinoplanes sp. OR16]|nr:hypothetical protein ACTI_09090 [Actinoplanes sp. OR16]